MLSIQFIRFVKKKKFMNNTLALPEAGKFASIETLQEAFPETWVLISEPKRHADLQVVSFILQHLPNKRLINSKKRLKSNLSLLYLSNISYFSRNESYKSDNMHQQTIVFLSRIPHDDWQVSRISFLIVSLHSKPISMLYLFFATRK
ncbi:MAG: hypothetical protein EAZ95_04045 [Bacteroidetes bacterium]|nr:MAG: hypothetical protein EAZ95_04045 [Bacteroidota bacterium]